MVRSRNQQLAYRRETFRINPKLEKQLGAYLAAVGAAGVGLMALSTQSEASVVYTPANITINANSPLSIDLNGDAITDLTITLSQASHFLILAGNVPPGNGLRLNASNFAAAGFFGVPVGPWEPFGTGSVVMDAVFCYGTCTQSGPWLNVNNKYLGVKFVIGSTTHYGWVRMSTQNAIVVTGYAYDTTPNHNIHDGSIAGPTQAGDLAPADLIARGSQPASLGLLARGADGLSIWRRDEES
jgi:hypothetical protein